MKASFPEFVSCVIPFSILWLFPQPHLTTSHLTHLLQLQLCPLFLLVPGCWLEFGSAGWQTSMQQSTVIAPSWPSLLLPHPSLSQESCIDLTSKGLCLH